MMGEVVFRVPMNRNDLERFPPANFSRFPPQANCHCDFRRLYLQVMRTICLMVEEWKADEVVDAFEEKVTELLGAPKKAASTMQA